MVRPRLLLFSSLATAFAATTTPAFAQPEGARAPPASSLPTPTDDETIRRTQPNPPSGARSEQAPGEVGRWPIWVFLDGTMQVSTGNVFGPRLRDLDAELLRLSAAVGIESIGRPDHTFEVLAGFGTETIERDLAVTSVRLAFGTNRGF